MAKMKIQSHIFDGPKPHGGARSDEVAGSYSPAQSRFRALSRSQVDQAPLSTATSHAAWRALLFSAFLPNR
jgi:hypothetical protein